MEGKPNNRAQFSEEGLDLGPIPAERWNSILDTVGRNAEELRRLSVEGQADVTWSEQVHTIASIQKTLDTLQDEVRVTPHTGTE